MLVNQSEIWRKFLEDARSAPKRNQNIPLRTEIEVVGLVGAGQGSCLILKDGGDAVVIDCGANPSNSSESESMTQKIVSRIIDVCPKYIVISHYHFDHFGALALTLKGFARMGLALPTIIATDMTWQLLKKNLGFFGFDTDSASSGRYRHIKHQTSTSNITLLDANHSVPGSASVWYQGNRNVLYTADFRKLDLPKQLSDINLLIVDSTGAMRDEPWEDTEMLAQETIINLAKEAFSKDSLSNVYVALFSTQLCRASGLEQVIKSLTGSLPKLHGSSLYRNLQAFRGHLSESTTERFNLVTGVWAQGEGNQSRNEDSALVKLSYGSLRGAQLKPGDMVILSGSIPVWSKELMGQINSMCKRINEMGVSVVIDSSFPKVEGSFARRAKVHCAGHGNMPEIVDAMEAVRAVSPNLQIMPFHGRDDALDRVARHCQISGMNIIEAHQGMVVSL